MNDTQPRLTPDQPLLRLQIEKILPAPRDRVWKAWTDPAQLAAWLADTSVSPPNPTKATADLRVGGSYSLTMHCGGGEYPHTGVYLTIREPELLIFTWQFHADPDSLPTVITVSLHEADNNQTRMVLTHERIDNQSDLESYEGGWTEFAEQLATYLEKGAVA